MQNFMSKLNCSFNICFLISELICYHFDKVKNILDYLNEINALQKINKLFHFWYFCETFKLQSVKNNSMKTINVFLQIQFL